MAKTNQDRKALKQKGRGQWSGRVGFILAASGSAIGLGNLWKFPYITFENGGGIFVIAYLACIILIGLPIMISEVSLGKLSQKNPIGAFKSLDGIRSPFRWVGILGVMSGFVILSYYSVVAGWSIENSINAIKGEYTSVKKADIDKMLKSPKGLKVVREKAFNQALQNSLKQEVKLQLLRDANILKKNSIVKLYPSKVNKLFNNNKNTLAISLSQNGLLVKWQSHFFALKTQNKNYKLWIEKQLLPLHSSNLFSTFYSNKFKMTLWHSVIMLLVFLIVVGGIRNGIERVTKFFMPILLLLIVFIAINSLMLDKENLGIKFLFSGDFSKFKGTSALEALGHAFFTLSLGMGAIMTYGSYLDKKTNIITNSIWIVSLDTAIALLACLMIFPILFINNMHGSEGVGILFTALPVEMAKFSLGKWLTLLFYILIFLAALTSAISLLEVVVSAFVDELKVSRLKAASIVSLIIYIFGVPSALYPDQFLGWADKIASNIMLPLGGLLIAIFVGYKMKKDKLKQEFIDAKVSLKWYKAFMISVRFISPILVLFVLYYLVQKEFIEKL